MNYVARERAPKLNRNNYQLLLLAANNIRGNKLNNRKLRNFLRSLFFIARVIGSCLAFLV
jgi:hypothetical protein